MTTLEWDIFFAELLSSRSSPIRSLRAHGIQCCGQHINANGLETLRDLIQNKRSNAGAETLETEKIRHEHLHGAVRRAAVALAFLTSTPPR